MILLEKLKMCNVELATQLVPSIRNITYSERLASLDLPSMNYKQKQGDLMLMHKLSTISYFN